MQKWTAFVLAALMAGFIAAVVLGRDAPGAHPHGGAVDAGADAAADASHDGAAPSASASAGATGASDAGEPADAGEPTDEPLALEPQGGPSSDAGATLLSGEAPPALAGDAPKSVVFGVILVQYKGAQGAPASARPRDAALDLAKQLAAAAKDDFKGTVPKGDKGSMENAGRMPRGMLEPAPEFVLFSLPKDGVSDPVDTPRGFWILRRIE
jgi:hypothetical protein